MHAGPAGPANDDCVCAMYGWCCVIYISGFGLDVCENVLSIISWV